VATESRQDAIGAGSVLLPLRRPTLIARSIANLADDPQECGYETQSILRHRSITDANCSYAEAPHPFYPEPRSARFEGGSWVSPRLACRERLKATMEATRACLTYNLRRWFGLHRHRVRQAKPSAIGERAKVLQVARTEMTAEERVAESRALHRCAQFLHTFPSLPPNPTLPKTFTRPPNTHRIAAARNAL
jgi:hypothetical protein